MPQNTDGKGKRPVSEAFAKQAGKGRPKGVLNKVTMIAKDAIAAAADQLGGVDRLVAWAQESPENERIFWGSIYPKLIPLQVNGTHDVNVVDRTEQVRRAEELVRGVFGERPGPGAGDHGSGLPN